MTTDLPDWLTEERRHLEKLLGQLRRLDAKAPAATLEELLTRENDAAVLFEDIGLFLDDSGSDPVISAAADELRLLAERIGDRNAMSRLHPDIAVQTLEHFARYLGENAGPRDETPLVVGVVRDTWVYMFVVEPDIVVTQHTVAECPHGAVTVMPAWLQAVLRDNFSMGTYAAGPAEGVSRARLETAAVLWDPYEERSPYTQFADAFEAAGRLV